MNALIANKIKAIAGAVVAALVAYIGTAITTDNGLTAHGLELAAVGAVLTFLGVHQAPANKPKPEKRRRRHPADRGAASGIVVLVIAICILAVFLGVTVNHLWLLLLLVLILLVL